MPRSKMPALFVLAGLVHGSAAAAPAPPLEVARAQLRAVNHRFIDPTVDPDGELIEALLDADFVHTRHDGAWLDRSAFVAQLRTQRGSPGAHGEDAVVRLFGPVAVVHGWHADAFGSNRPTRLRYTDVYRWSGSAWRLVSVQDTPLPEGVAVEQEHAAPPAHGRWQAEDPIGDAATVLRALNEHYVRAFRDADVAWYAAHLSEDCVVINGDGSIGDRAAALRRFALPTFATSMKAFPVDQVRIRRFGELALIHAQNAYELKDGRRGVSRYTDIWHRQGGRWRCVAAHITARQAPA